MSRRRRLSLGFCFIDALTVSYYSMLSINIHYNLLNDVTLFSFAVFIVILIYLLLSSS